MLMCNSFPKINSWEKKTFSPYSTPWFIGQTCWTVPDAAPISEAWAWANKTWNLVTLQSLVTVSAKWRDQNFHQDWYWDFFETKISETESETFFESKIFDTDTDTFFKSKIFETEISFRPNFLRLISIPIYVTLWWALDKHDRKIKPRDFLHFTATLSNSTSMGKQKIYNTQQLFRVTGDVICMRK